MKTRYNNYPIDRLWELYAKYKADLQNGFEKACDVLTEIYSRGERHPDMRSGIYKFHREVSEGKLAAKAVLAFAGYQTLINALKGVPIEKQIAFAEGETVTVVDRNSANEFVRSEKIIDTLNVEQINRVFFNGRIRSAAEQEKLLRSDASRKQVKRIGRVTIEGEFLRIGNSKLTVQELVEPLRALGYTIKKLRIAS